MTLSLWVHFKLFYRIVSRGFFATARLSCHYLTSVHDVLDSYEMWFEWVGDNVDVLSLTRLADGQRLYQLIGVSLDRRLDALSLLAHLAFHRLEVLQQARLGVLSTDQHDIAWGSAKVGLDQRSYCTSGPVNTWMGDRLCVNHLGITSHLGHLSLSSFRGQ